MPRLTLTLRLVGLGLLAAALAPTSACSPVKIPARTSIDQPQALAFRCVYPAEVPDGAEDVGDVVGVPLEGCGCTARDPDGTLRALGRVECRCKVLASSGAEVATCRNGLDDDGDGLTDGADPDCGGSTGADAGAAPPSLVEGPDDLCKNGRDDDDDGYADADDPGCALGAADVFVERTVKRVLADCGGAVEGDAATCTPKRSALTGDLIPAPDATRDTVDTMACEPGEQGTVRAYVGASGRGEVAVVDVADHHRILDVDKSIPGITAIYVDDLVSDVASDPDGRFVFTVNSSTGSISLVRHDDVGVATTIELVQAPLFAATVYPPATAPRGSIAADARRLAWVTAPTVGALIELDLDTLAGLRADRDRHGPPPGLVRRTLTLRAVDALGQPIPGGIVRPGRPSVDADGRWLYVADLDRPAVVAVDLQNPENQRTVWLAPTRCEDGYLVDVVDLARACKNGRDDDGDGLVDAADPECAAGLLWEGGAVDPCYQQPECENGLDDDGDGTIDGCTGRFEGPVPACANGLDDDGDGRIDRADPDCETEADESEAGREVSTCANGRDDNGGDGADRADPRCEGALERCDDGEDNDGDGAIDTEDDDCRDPDRPLIVGLPEEVGEARAAPAALGGDADSAATGDSPCNDGLDNDGDGLSDADDPGCRLYSAARRFSFEALPACGDGLDNDRDGRIDYPEDPDCYAASDRNEGGKVVATGLGDLVALRQRLDSGETARALYVANETTGDVVALDFGTDEHPLAAPDQRVLPLDTPVQAMTLRQTETTAALILVDQDGTLSTLELVGPRLVTDTDGRPVFAHLVFDEAEKRYLVDSFYVVHRGHAARLGALDAYAGDILTDDQREDIADGIGLPPLALSIPSPVAPPSLTPEGDVPAGGGLTVYGPDDPTIDWNPRGARDPVVAVAGSTIRLEEPTNVRTTAAGRSNRLAGSPELRVRDASVPFDPAKFPGFCVADPTAPPAEDGTLSACRLLGRDAEGEPEESSAADQRTAELVQGNEAIRLVTDAVDVLPADTFSLTYEGELPASRSPSGVFGGKESTTPAHRWSLLDYDRDFCRVGVEPGDVLLVDDFVPVAPSLGDLPDTCAALANAAAAYGNPTEYREPLKYFVREVSAHRLVVATRPEGAESQDVEAFKDRYQAQVRLDARVENPRVAPPSPVPEAACAAQFISYHLRAADEQWLLTGQRAGLRHPWTNRDGHCVRHPDRADRTGRVSLGKRFRNEWFEFDFGFLPKTGAATTGVPEGQSPHQLDTHYEFTTLPGRQFNAVSGEIVLPRALYWLPVDDRLYLVDTGLNTIAEFTGFEPYLNRPALVRRYN